MKLMTLLQAYNFDELMPVINDMFPGTGKYRDQLKQGYDIMLAMHPAASKKAIRYVKMKQPNSEFYYFGALDSSFNTTWEAALGKEVSKDKGVDLDDVEILANCLVNLCLQGKYPPAFKQAHDILMKAD